MLRRAWLSHNREKQGGLYRVADSLPDITFTVTAGHKFGVGKTGGFQFRGAPSITGVLVQGPGPVGPEADDTHVFGAEGAARLPTLPVNSTPAGAEPRVATRKRPPPPGFGNIPETSQRLRMDPHHLQGARRR